MKIERNEKESSSCQSSASFAKVACRDCRGEQDADIGSELAVGCESMTSESPKGALEAQDEETMRIEECAEFVEKVTLRLKDVQTFLGEVLVHANIAERQAQGWLDSWEAAMKMEKQQQRPRKSSLPTYGGGATAESQQSTTTASANNNAACAQLQGQNARQRKVSSRVR